MQETEILTTQEIATIASTCYDITEALEILRSIEYELVHDTKEEEIDLIGSAPKFTEVDSFASGQHSSKYRRGEETQEVKEIISSEKSSYLSSLSPSTVSSFRALYSEHKEQIEYRIRFGSAHERTQSTIMKNVALAVA